MDAGTITPICFAVPLGIALVIREYRWRQRLSTWERVDGKVVGFDENPERDATLPIIEYSYRGVLRERICEFNLRSHSLGEILPVVVNPDSGEVFVASPRDRWALSVILLGCVAFLVVLATLSN